MKDIISKFYFWGTFWGFFKWINYKNLQFLKTKMNGLLFVLFLTKCRPRGTFFLFKGLFFIRFLKFPKTKWIWTNTCKVFYKIWDKTGISLRFLIKLYKTPLNFKIWSCLHIHLSFLEFLWLNLFSDLKFKILRPNTRSEILKKVTKKEFCLRFHTNFLNLEKLSCFFNFHKGLPTGPLFLIFLLRNLTRFLSFFGLFNIFQEFWFLIFIFKNGRTIIQLFQKKLKSKTVCGLSFYKNEKLLEKVSSKVSTFFWKKKVPKKNIGGNLRFPQTPLPYYFFK